MSIFETFQNAYQCRLHTMEVKALKIKTSPVIRAPPLQSPPHFRKAAGRSETRPAAFLFFTLSPLPFVLYNIGINRRKV